MGGFITDRMGCQLQKFLKNSVLSQHILTLFTFYLIITVSQQDFIHPIENCILTLQAYIFYILFTKMNLTMTMIVCVLLFIVFVITYTKEYNNEKLSDEDPNKKYNIQKLENIKQIIIKLIYILVLMGAVLYFLDKKKEYKNKFNFITFILGVQKCKSL
jgi:Ca2+/Na+ antiporter